MLRHMYSKMWNQNRKYIKYPSILKITENVIVSLGQMKVLRLFLLQIMDKLNFILYYI